MEPVVARTISGQEGNTLAVAASRRQGLVGLDNLCNKCIMIGHLRNSVGRPKRTRDVELTQQLMARRLDAKMTASDLARRLGVAPSTLARSMNKQSFSVDLGNRAREMLSNPKAFDREKIEGPASPAAPKSLNAKDMQILHKIIKLLPAAEVILRGLVGRPAQRNKA